MWLLLLHWSRLVLLLQARHLWQASAYQSCLVLPWLQSANHQVTRHSPPHPPCSAHPHTLTLARAHTLHRQGFGVPPRTVVEYSPCERWTVRSMALVFVGGCVLFSVLTVLQWGPGFTNGVHKLVEAPSAPVNLLRQAQVPLATGVSMVVTGVVMPTLLTLNETINGIVDLNSTNHNMVCVDQTVDNIPDTNELLHQLALANASLFEVKGGCWKE